jgi:non-specific serine/threonine protein kinase
MQPHIRPIPSRRRHLLPHGASWSHRATTASADLEFRRFRVLLRRRQLIADGVPVELGTRAFDLLLTLLEADGSLVTKEELMSRVWPGIVVSEENIKLQVSVLRKALGAERDVIHTEFGRGYRFTGVLRTKIVSQPCQPRRSKAAAWPNTLPTELSAFAPMQCLGKMRTTWVRRLISSFKRSSILVDLRCLWCWRGNR